MGIGEHADQVYIIEFGLAKKYRDSRTHTHIPLGKRDLRGTAPYASINAHLGIEQSRRDDLEALVYVWLYFLLGKLPWQGKLDEKQRVQRYLEMKVATTIESLCQDLPQEFVTYFKYVRTLKFDETPDHDYLRKLFRDLYIREGYEDDLLYDWTVLEHQVTNH